MDELRERITEALSEYFAEYKPEEVGINYTVVTDRVLALLPTEGEPVAWDVRDARNGKLHYSIHSETHDAERRLEYALGSDLYTVVPLYTAPQESTEVERLRSALEKTMCGTMGSYEETCLTEDLPRLNPEVVCDRCAALNTETDG